MLNKRNKLCVVPWRARRKIPFPPHTRILTSRFVRWLSTADQVASRSPALEAIAFRVEQLHSHALSMPSVEKLRKHIHITLCGHILRLKQQLCILYDGSSMRLSVVRLADNQAALKEAFLLGTHKRLGSDAPLIQDLTTKTIRIILSFAFDSAAISGMVTQSTTVITETENIWVADEAEWNLSTTNHASLSGYRSPSLAWPPAFDMSNIITPRHGRPLDDALEPEQLVGHSYALSASNSLQPAIPERHSSFFTEPSKDVPSLPDAIQHVMCSTDERIERLNDELQSLAASFAVLSARTPAMQAEDDPDSPMAKLRQMLSIREEESDALREQLALRLEQVTALQEALVQSLMQSAFVKPAVRTEIQERVVSVSKEIPTYVDRVSELVVPVYTTVEKIKEVPVERIVHVEKPYEVERTVEVQKDLIREVPVVQHRLVEVPREIVTTEKLVQVDQKEVVSIMLQKEVVVEREKPVDVVREVPVTGSSPL